MTIEASPYELVARADGRRRAGALLRVASDDGVRGYADVHPWPELGDPPLERQIQRLARGEPLDLAVVALGMAFEDGRARAEGRSLFDGLTVPTSHASLPFGHSPAEIARAAAEGYRFVKVKGCDFTDDERRTFRDSGLRFRLDFNNGLSPQGVARRLEAWGDLDWVDWLEDPCPYDPEAWEGLRRASGVRLALDFGPWIATEGFDVRVVKPARDGDSPPRPPRLAYTSYLDHPLGQVTAAWVAACALGRGRSIEPGGLLTHDVYEETPFSARLGVREGRLVPPLGSGFGFGEELERLEWRPLYG